MGSVTDPVGLGNNRQALLSVSGAIGQDTDAIATLMMEAASASGDKVQILLAEIQQLQNTVQLLENIMKSGNDEDQSVHTKPTQ